MILNGQDVGVTDLTQARTKIYILVHDCSKRKELGDPLNEQGLGKKKQSPKVSQGGAGGRSKLGRILMLEDKGLEV